MTAGAAGGLPAGGPMPVERIEVRDLRVMGVHGVTPEERQQAQPISIDLDVELRPGRAASTDDLADTVDYGDLVARVAAVVGDRSFALLEALAGAVADAVLQADVRVQQVGVTVRKLRPPLPFDLGSVGVRISRART